MKAFSKDFRKKKMTGTGFLLLITISLFVIMYIGG